MRRRVEFEALCEQPLAEGWQACMEQVALAALQTVGASENTELSVNIIDEARMQELNRDTRGMDSVTDVLSFPFIDFETDTLELAAQQPFNLNPDTGRLMLGDIVICLPRALQQAADYGHSEQRELAFLTVHGVLHLCGYDHIEKDDEVEMFALQEQILSQCSIER